MSETPPERIFFDATLVPHRSLPPKGLTWIMAGLSGVGFCTGIGFVAAGAWPVTPFFGLDVLLLYLAFRINYRRAREVETLRLTETALDIERVSRRGERQRWHLQPFWVRVTIEESEDGRGRLLLASHGKTLSLGAFLSAQERRSVAESLRAALRAWREALRA